MDKKVSIDRHLRYLFPVLDLFIIALLRSLIITGAWFPRIFVCLLGLAVHAYVKLFERFLWKLKWILAKQKHAYLIILNVSGDAQEKHYYDQLMLKSLKLKKKRKLLLNTLVLLLFHGLILSLILKLDVDSSLLQPK